MGIRIICKADGKEVEYGVTKIPTRINKCLYRMIGNELIPLAYFKSDADAQEFEDFLKVIVPSTSGL
jgi:hypothetical protein